MAHARVRQRLHARPDLLRRTGQVGGSERRRLLHLGGIAAHLVADLVEAAARLLDLLRVAVADEEVPDLRVARRDRLHDLRPHAANQDRRMGALDGLRLARRVGERVVLALVRRARLGEERFQHLDRLAETAGAAARGVERDAVGRVLAFEPAGADAEDQPAVARVVDRDGRLREHGGEAIRVARDEEPHADAARLRGERGEQRPALEARTVRIRHDRHEVIEREDGVEAEIVGFLPDRQQVLVGRLLRRRLHAEAERRSPPGLRDGLRAEQGGRRAGGADRGDEFASRPIRHMAPWRSRRPGWIPVSRSSSIVTSPLTRTKR